MSIAVLVISAFLGAAPAVAKPAPPGITASPVVVDRAEAAVRENLMTEAGRMYADSASKVATGPLSSVAKACMDSLKAFEKGAPVNPNAEALDVYLMLNRRGFIKALTVREKPESETCLTMRATPILALPPPPGPNYWIKVQITRLSAK